MGTIVMAATAVLVVLGFSDPVWWLAAVALLYLYVRYGRDASSASSGTPPASAGSPPATYQAYKARRDQQAKWERRYRRERPFEARRQESTK
ncbi:hypothetical protein C3489_34695 [Streptomyces sp. Ru71]|uniref:hypothetical protein n=1 Tax=Streptomyces sp. Ru71 TaxID=2080746 RepID=UPI000CDD216D|nr:hypothetical protein [Streptomyces sp. Ru71]POX45269.1 hypothetical protein C3489_34695 [Streptomyces sp. Ru71]